MLHIFLWIFFFIHILIRRNMYLYFYFIYPYKINIDSGIDLVNFLYNFFICNIDSRNKKIQKIKKVYIHIYVYIFF